MKYDISKSKAPEMPNLGKGTECIKLLLSQASKDVHAPLVPMFFPSLGAHISDAEFQYPDRHLDGYRNNARSDQLHGSYLMNERECVSKHKIE